MTTAVPAPWDVVPSRTNPYSPADADALLGMTEFRELAGRATSRIIGRGVRGDCVRAVVLAVAAASARWGGMPDNGIPGFVHPAAVLWWALTLSDQTDLVGVDPQATLFAGLIADVQIADARLAAAWACLVESLIGAAGNGHLHRRRVHALPAPNRQAIEGYHVRSIDVRVPLGTTRINGAWVPAAAWRMRIRMSSVRKQCGQVAIGISPDRRTVFLASDCAAPLTLGEVLRAAEPVAEVMPVLEPFGADEASGWPDRRTARRPRGVEERLSWADPEAQRYALEVAQVTLLGRRV